MNSKWQRMRRILKEGIRWRLTTAEIFLNDVSDADLEVILKVRPFTMTTPERLLGFINAVRYIEANQIPGSIVECGVWKGGSMMAAALTLLATKGPTRQLHLFDTFSGMTAPSQKDSTRYEDDPQKAYEERKKESGIVEWSYSPLEVTRGNLLSTGYPAEKVHFVKGPVEQTIPEHAPGEIAILRLDTDFYESSKHELIHLYPRLAIGGVLIIDDYGHWEGARLAVDEYFSEHKIPMLLNRLDYTGRLGVKIR
jgi:hypothetical protein